MILLARQKPVSTYLWVQYYCNTCGVEDDGESRTIRRKARDHARRNPGHTVECKVEETHTYLYTKAGQ